MLVNYANVKINQPRTRNINANPLHGKPQKQLLRRDAGQALDLAIGEGSGDVVVVVKLVLELGVASAAEEELEATGGGVEGEIEDVGG